jgi:hypothetical protein
MTGPVLPAQPDVDLVRRFIMASRFPPPWGPAMETALRDSLVAAGCKVSRCSCMAEHRVAIVRFRCPEAGHYQVAAIRRLFRRVVRELGANVPANGLNCAVRRNRVEIEAVVEQPSV